MSMDMNVHNLETIAIFDGVDSETKRHIAEQCTWRRYRAGHAIVSHLDTSQHVYLLRHGSVRASSVTVSGRDITYRDIQAGEMFGEFAAIDGEPRSSDVAALEDCIVAILSADLFWHILESQPSVMRRVMQSLVQQNRMMTDRFFDLSVLAVKNRLHTELLRLANENAGDGDRVELKANLTHAEIAARIGTHREAVTRELSHLTNMGILSRAGQKLYIENIQRLREIVEAARGPSEF